jgi:hypothetical protein
MKGLKIVSIVLGLAAAVLALICVLKARTVTEVITDEFASQNADVAAEAFDKMLVMGTYSGVLGVATAILGLAALVNRFKGAGLAAALAAVVLLGISVLLYRDAGPLSDAITKLEGPSTAKVPDFSGKNWLWFSADNIPAPPLKALGTLAYGTHLMGKKAITLIVCALVFCLSMILARFRSSRSG